MVAKRKKKKKKKKEKKKKKKKKKETPTFSLSLTECHLIGSRTTRQTDRQTDKYTYVKTTAHSYSLSVIIIIIGNKFIERSSSSGKGLFEIHFGLKLPPTSGKYQRRLDSLALVQSWQ